MMEQQNLRYNPHLGKPIAPLPPVDDPGLPDFFKGKLNMFMVVFVELVTTMQTEQQTVLTGAKQVASDAHDQNSINGRIGDIHINVLPYGAKTSTINRYQEEDEGQQGKRAVLQNMLLSAKETGQLDMTQTETEMNILNQASSQNTGLVSTVDEIYQAIVDMTKTNQS